MIVNPQRFCLGGAPEDHGQLRMGPAGSDRCTLRNRGRTRRTREKETRLWTAQCASVRAVATTIAPDAFAKDLGAECLEGTSKSDSLSTNRHVLRPDELLIRRRRQSGSNDVGAQCAQRLSFFFVNGRSPSRPSSPDLHALNRVFSHRRSGTYAACWRVGRPNGRKKKKKKKEQKKAFVSGGDIVGFPKGPQ